MKLFGKEFPDIPGRDKKLDAERLGIEHTVRVELPKEEAKDAKDIEWDKNTLGMIEDVVYQESARSIAKAVSKSIFNQRVHEISKEDLKKSIELISEFGEGFILINTHLATLIEMTWDGLLELEENKVTHTVEMIFKMGKIGNYELFVDPNMLYNDNKLAITTNNFWNYKESENVKLITEGTAAPRITAKTKVIVNDPKSKVFSINDLKI